MSEPTYIATLPARRFVVKAQASELLEMLGLITDDGDVPPDDNNVYTFSSDHAGKAPGASTPDGTRTKPMKDRSAVPEGLRNLPPEGTEEPVKKRRGPKPQPKVIRPRREREVPECGTYKAFSRHKRRIAAGVEGEVLDDACLEAGRKYHREASAASRTRRLQQEERDRLTRAGVQTESAIETLVELAR